MLGRPKTEQLDVRMLVFNLKEKEGGEKSSQPATRQVLISGQLILDKHLRRRT